jgi:outer membrane protein assembly factor BamD
VNRLLAILTIFIFVSCSEYGEVLKKGTLTQKYDYAVKAYQKKDYVRALPLFEELLAAYRGQPKSEEIYFYYCYCYFGQGQYELAAYHFKNFTENYYNSKHMEECAFMYTKCLYKDALPYFLDQTNTEKAISEIQAFLNIYPNSTFKDECNTQVEYLRKTLQKKAYENALLFYKIEDYNAAVISFKNAIKSFPDIENKDYIEFLILKSSYLLAKYSVDEKLVDRYNSVFKEYAHFVKYNKGSKYSKQAIEINEKAVVELNKYKKTNNII